ncbi:MBL fold metallo-hydrolase [Halobacillus seohaensis]|uniref:MBL fold metallo-hydrolase n=1 Tax=Halobacillus seohaensis TaxID=447421 RepID=A0ABW2EGE6_9BACI
MKTLRDTVYQITIPTPYAVGDVHVYLLEGDILTLIDAGVKTEQAWVTLQEELKRLNYKPEDIQQIVLTHHHPDHMGLMEKFPNATVAGHPKLKPWLERDEAFFEAYEIFFREMYLESGVPEKYFYMLKELRKPLKWISDGKLEVELVEGDMIPGHEEWLVLETPGHAQSHLSFYREADGAFIGGDLLLFHISSNPLLEPPHAPGEPRPRPLLQYRESMEKLLDYKINTVFPGHGEIFFEVEDLIVRRLRKQEERADKVKAMFQTGSLTTYQVCTQLFPKHIESQFGLTMSETVGQLDYLEYTGQIQSFYQGEQKIYYVNR